MSADKKTEPVLGNKGWGARTGRNAQRATYIGRGPGRRVTVDDLKARYGIREDSK